jgi:exopolyphosphatase/guanosine-5'-triphosphate,3'-diphosphate pyrophosphatase
MRLAAIDIGTNSVHMIVVRVRPDLSFEVIDREKEMVRLGAGGLDGKALTPAAMAAGLQALSKFRRLADAHEVDEIIATATSAVREAENGGDFLAAIAEQTGIRARVISGFEEARLIHIAATYGIELEGGRGVVIDIGGGSAEITLGTPNDVQLAKSFKIGVIRLTERFVKSDPLSSRDERRLVKHIEREIASHIEQVRKRGFTRVIGTSGTILSLGSVAAADEGTTVGSDIRNVRVSAKAIRKLRKRLVSMDQRERLDVPGLDPRRADISVAGSVLIETILRLLDAEELTLCDLALREGLILDYINRNQALIAKIDRYPDIRRRSVLELGERCNYWSAHTQQVARLALALFDQTAKVHELGEKEREWLEYGALLHDVGVHISYERHHQHSYYLIKNGDLRGFEPEEIEIIALVARYHRRGKPKKSDDEFASLRSPLRRAVQALSAMTTLAEGLDRSHSQVVLGLDVIDRNNDVVIRLRCASDAELELWAAHRYVRPLEKLLGKPVRFELATGTYAQSVIEAPLPALPTAAVASTAPRSSSTAALAESLPSDTVPPNTEGAAAPSARGRQSGRPRRAATRRTAASRTAEGH